MSGKPKITTQISVKVIKNGDGKPEHPLYNALTHQIGAAVIIARRINEEKGNFMCPEFVERFLDEFGRRAA